MTEIGWKRRLAIVLSFIWIALVTVISLNERRDEISVFLSLGVLPLSLLWGIAWVWSGFRKNRKASRSTDLPGNTNDSSVKTQTSPIQLNETLSKKENAPVIAHGKRPWYSNVLIFLSSFCLALFAALLVRSIIKDGDVVYHFGMLTLPSILLWYVLSIRNASKKYVGIAIATLFAVSFTFTGINKWNEVLSIKKFKETAQAILTKQIEELQEIDSSTESTTKRHTDKISQQPPTPSVAKTNKPASLSRKEQIDFMTTFISEASERESKLINGYEDSINALKMESILEPENLISLTKINESRGKIASLESLLDNYETAYNKEFKWQDDRVLAWGGAKHLTEFREGRAPNVKLLKDGIILGRKATTSSKEILNLMGRVTLKEEVILQDGQLLFYNHDDLEDYNRMLEEGMKLVKQTEVLSNKILEKRKKTLRKFKNF